MHSGLIVSSDTPKIKSHRNTEYCPVIYELIPAHGCEFECAYCNVYSLKEKKTFYPVTVFEKYPELVRTTIEEHRSEGRDPVYYFSPKTDVFQSALVSTRITHKILEVMNEERAKFILVSKGSLPDNEVLDLLKEAEGRGRVLVSYGMKNEEHAKVLEPNAAPLYKRFEFAKKCSENSIPAMGIIEPILPLKDLSFVYDILKRFVDIGVDHFAIDFARISKECLEGLIQSLPELQELRDIYYSPQAIAQDFGTGAYVRESVVRYAPSYEYHEVNFNKIRDYAASLNATVSICNYFRVPGINVDAYKRGFLCFGIHDPTRSEKYLKRELMSDR